MLLTNSNGEYGDGSSNKTPHIVGHVHRPPLVAHTLQLDTQIGGGDKKGGKPREHVYCTAGGGEIQGPLALLFPVETRQAASLEEIIFGPLLSLLRRDLKLCTDERLDPFVSSQPQAQQTASALQVDVKIEKFAALALSSDPIC